MKTLLLDNINLYGSTVQTDMNLVQVSPIYITTANSENNCIAKSSELSNNESHIKTLEQSRDRNGDKYR